MSVGGIRHLSICLDSGTCSQSFDSVTNLKRGNTLDLGKPGIWIRDAAHKTRHSSGTVRSANLQDGRRHDEGERVCRQIFPGQRQGFPQSNLEDRLVFGAVGSFIPALDQGIGDQRVMVQPDPDTSEGPFIVAREREFCLVQHFQQAIA